jgi:hypothetical protein
VSILQAFSFLSCHKKETKKVKAAPHFPKNNAPRRQENELGVTGSSSTFMCDFWPLRLRFGCLKQRFLAFGHPCIIFLTEIAPRPGEEYKYRLSVFMSSPKGLRAKPISYPQ